MEYMTKSLERIILFSLLFLINSNLILSQDNKIPFIKVTSPNGGESFEANSAQTITWQSNNIDKVKIDYSLDGGYSWIISEESIDASLGEYSWTVVDAQTPNFLVRVSNASNS